MALLSSMGFVAPGALAAAQSVSPKPLSLVCEFEAPGLETVGDDTRVRVAGCEVSRRVGEPALPYRTIRLLLPPDSEVAALTAQAEVPPTTLPGSWRVEPNPAPTPTPGMGKPAPAKAVLAAPDPTIYLSDASYPAAPAELASVQRMSGYDIAFIRVFPVACHPLSGQLLWHSRLRVTLTLKARSSSVAESVQAPGGAATLQKLAQLVDNPEMLASAGNAGRASTKGSGIFDYLLITKSNLVTAFQPLVNRKVADGLSVQVATVEAIHAGYPGRDDAERIRNFIRYAYTNWGIAYVLLGGDSATVPCRYGYAYMGGLVTDYLVPTDLYYACLDGSWDKNGNSIFGEPADGETGGEVDLLAEVYVGRAPVDAAAEVSVFVDKQARYETEAHAHPMNALMMAEYLGSAGAGPSQGGDMFDPLLPYLAPYQLTWLDDRPFTTPQWTTANAIAALNNAPHLVLFNGHGDTDAMMRMYTEDVTLLTNPSLFLTYSVGCNAGEFDNDIFSPDCIGEELVKQHSRGAFAAILNSRLGWYDPANEWRWSGEFQIQFFREMLTNGNTRLGAANQWSKHDMLSHVETSGLMTYRWCYFEITLFGDPHAALRMPAANPQLIVASARGGASPPVGTNVYSPATLLSCAVTNSPLSDGPGTQYVCTGWTGTGSVPSTGSGTQASFTLQTNSQLTWTWKTQVWFAASASGSGFINVANGWRDAGTGLAVQAVASNYHHFVRWTGDVPAGMESNAALNLTMNQARTLTAAFAPNVTALGTPEWWLAGYGWTNQFEAASLADSDHDGMAAWAEYLAGTSPVDSSSVFRARSASGQGSETVLRWPSVADHWYAVYRADAPAGIFTRLTNGIPATPPMNTFTDAAAGPVRFYRVGVTNSP